ncbi:glycosyltransferase [Cellvibrio sp. QJXJ]|uniref:glycosyltransferase n=1 Tax=Cellvibrio sp. QJXJ TaxID=2964606 RepID=UPI0021C4AB8C|nr:glycosyltransferase [Cellvibrio sp. QJXJ]UUA71401.1 glycosyltransferase [Cellvibrio sp. QJXJ]
MNYETPLKWEPFVSIVMPAFNEEKYIELSLIAVMQMDYPKHKLEIIVVDNGSTDKTVEIAKRYADKVIVHPNVKVGGVRNEGVRQSNGEIIAFIDSDCLPAKGWLRDSLDYMKENSCDAVGGIYLLREHPSWVESAWLINPKPKDGVTNRLVGGSILISKDSFISCGMFDEALNAGEDYALARALKEKGFVLHEAKSCALVHLGYPTNLLSFMARQYWHSSSYLKSKKKGGADFLFLIVAAYAVGILLLPLSALVIPSMLLPAISIIFLFPGILSVKRIVASGYKSHRLDSYLKIYLLDFCYLLGRVGGLLKSLMTELNLIPDKKSHY